MVLPASVVTPVRIEVSPGHHLAVRRRGAGGVPLLLLHGFPCTSLIWSHNLIPLAEAGFDVVAPDLRGYGDSDFAPDGFYDFNAFNTDLIGLFEGLGWDRAVVAGHDLGAMIAIDLATRHAARVDRLVILDDSMPALTFPDLPPIDPKHAVYDYVRNQGLRAEALVAELATPDQRRRYIAEFYGHRLWCPPDAFSPEDLAFLTTPYDDPARLRASFADYEVVMGTRELSAPELTDRPVDHQTLILIGTDQITLRNCVEERCLLAFPNAVGPFWVKGAGHFLPWERPTIVNRAIRSFCGDLLSSQP
ncbi:alpha/beta hydrolase [Kribbella antibiotica]|uniref:Alpha/beta hydrolase n=1 Tax=Kribbella antibiotica TaxID=190195 RepID=A0A4R4ZG50_9ACTN|nr:alpha/beta hydrolase [Kribbella antibiotica]TDD56369.1 alpha/beta hydrolase [Kribbella antibiotica]